MKIALLGSVVAALLISISTTSIADEARPTFAIAKAQARELAFLAAPIKTSQDLKVYLESIEGRHSPLNKLSGHERDRFLQSITWNERGVTGFNSLPFHDITASDTYQILALFGIQHVTPILGSKVRNSTDTTIMSLGKDLDNATPMSEGGEYTTDYADRKCSSRATCSVSYSDICMGSC